MSQNKFKRAMSLPEHTRKLRVMRLHALSLLWGGMDLEIIREEGDYFWIDSEQSDNLGLGIVGLCNIVALEYEKCPKLAEKALIAVLTSGFSNPAKLLRAVVTEMGSNHTLNPLRFHCGTFETSLNANRSAQAFTADLSRKHQSVQLLTIQGARGAFRRNDELLAVKPKHEELLNAVCVHVFSAAIKVITKAQGAADSALRRVQWKHGGRIIPERYEMSQQFGKGAFSLIVQSLFLRYLLVFMYLNLYHKSAPSWVRMVVDLGRILEDAGVPVYRQIRDHLLISPAAPLALTIFSNDLFALEVAVDQAVKLGVLAPFVQFLNRAESSFFEARNFPCIIPFLRGYLQAVMPSNSNSTKSTAYRDKILHRLGKMWGKTVLSRAASANPEVIKTTKKENKMSLKKRRADFKKSSVS